MGADRVSAGWAGIAIGLDLFCFPHGRVVSVGDKEGAETVLYRERRLRGLRAGESETYRSHFRYRVRGWSGDGNCSQERINASGQLVFGRTRNLGWALAAYAGKTPRFVIGGGVIAVVGIVVGLSKVSLGAGEAILYGITGMLSLASGVMALLLFICKPDRADD